MCVGHSFEVFITSKELLDPPMASSRSAIYSTHNTKHEYMCHLPSYEESLKLEAKEVIELGLLCGPFKYAEAAFHVARYSRIAVYSQIATANIDAARSLSLLKRLTPLHLRVTTTSQIPGSRQTHEMR